MMFTEKNITKTALINLANIKAGYQSRKRIVENQNGKYLLIRGQDFNGDGNLEIGKLIKIVPERKPEPYMVTKDDILFQARGTSNFTYCLNREFKNTLAAGIFYIMRIKTNKIIPQFLSWWLNQWPAKSYFKSNASQTIISFVSKNVIEQLLVPVPPIMIQKKIVRLHQLWDKEQQLYSKLIKNKKLLLDKIGLASILKKEEKNE